jgi:hypothetical protein
MVDWLAAAASRPGNKECVFAYWIDWEAPRINPN